MNTRNDKWTFKSAMAFALVAVLMLSMCMVACSETQIISAVEAAIQAAEIAVPLVAGAAGIPPATVAQLLDYLQSVSNALSQVSTILAKGGTAASVATQITAALASVINQDTVIQGQIGTLPTAIVAAISKVIDAIQNIQNTYGAPSTTALAKMGTGEYHFTGKNLARIESDQAKAVALAAKIAVVRVGGFRK